MAGPTLTRPFHLHLPPPLQVLSSTGVPSHRVRPPSAGHWAGRPVKRDPSLGMGWQQLVSEPTTLDDLDGSSWDNPY